ncbi:MAG: tetratricopeptide repeat protein [Bacteroidia bacterium]|nr:tetratricopeptide repeat protein [Bacteroidia bacterium]
MAISYNNLGNIYHHHKEYEKAKEFYQKSLKIKKIKFGESHLTVAITYLNIAQLYLDGDTLDNLQHLYDVALEICLNNFSEKNPQISQAYIYKGEYHNKKEEYILGLSCYQQALINLIKHFNNQSFYINPPIHKKLFISDYTLLLSTISKKAETLFTRYNYSNR